MLDVKNVFNSAFWKIILREFKKKENRRTSNIQEIILEAEGTGTRSCQINSGVPQGSAMGLTLWNVLYDNLLNMKFLKFEAVLMTTKGK